MRSWRNGLCSTSLGMLSFDRLVLFHCSYHIWYAQHVKAVISRTHLGMLNGEHSRSIFFRIKNYFGKKFSTARFYWLWTVCVLSHWSDVIVQCWNFLVLQVNKSCFGNSVSVYPDVNSPLVFFLPWLVLICCHSTSVVQIFSCITPYIHVCGLWNSIIQK